MTDPHRTWAGAAPDQVRCGPSAPVADVERSWHGVGNRRRASSTPHHPPLFLPALPAFVLGGIVTALVGSSLALALLPAGTAAGVGATGSVPGRPVAVTASDTEPEAPPPSRVTIERLGVDSDLVNLKIQRDGTLQVPEDFARAGWHRSGTAPGNTGPAVLVGHVDSVEGPAVFFRLPELVPGDLVTVTRADSSQVTFEVYGQETVDKDAFPTDRVYGATEGAELRLLTCGGSFDADTRSYSENVVVYARLVAPPAAS